MHRPFRIVSFSAEALDIPLLEPFGISGGAQAAANNVLVTLELDDGSRGWGEAAPLPPYNGETQGQALAALKAARSWLEGREATDWKSLAVEEVEQREGHLAESGVPRAGARARLLEVARKDLEAAAQARTQLQAADLPVERVAQGPETGDRLGGDELAALIDVNGSTGDLAGAVRGEMPVEFGGDTTGRWSGGG